MNIYSAIFITESNLRGNGNVKYNKIFNDVS